MDAGVNPPVNPKERAKKFDKFAAYIIGLSLANASVRSTGSEILQAFEVDGPNGKEAADSLPAGWHGYIRNSNSHNSCCRSEIGAGFVPAAACTEANGRQSQADQFQDGDAVNRAV